MKKISVVGPAYKREQTIIECVTSQLEALAKAAKKYGMDYELIVVEDGQLDGTSEQMKAITDPHVKFISYKKNRGKGFAVKIGMLQATGDYIGYADIGKDLNPNAIERMVTALVENPDVHIVVGSKKHPNSILVYPFKRKLMTFGYALVCKAFTGIGYADTQVGAKMYTKELVRRVLPRLLIKKFAFEVEMLAVAGLLGYDKHIDIPVEIDFGTGPSAATKFGPIMDMIKDTMAVGYRLYILNYYHEKNSKLWPQNMYDISNS